MKQVDSSEKDLAAAGFVRNFSKRTRMRVLRSAIAGTFDDNLLMLGSSIAFGGTLAFFPLVAACVAFAGLVVQPDQLQEIVGMLDQYLPDDIASLLTAQISNAIGHTSANIWVAFIATTIAIIGVSNAVGSVVRAVNMVYGLKETRHFLKLRLMGIGMTIVMTLGMLLVVPLIVLNNAIVEGIGVPPLVASSLLILRWPLLALLMMIGLAIFYRFAPNRARGTWQWLTWGSVVATCMWIVVTVLFFVYLQHFANVSDSYSLFAGIVALMIWLNFSGLVVLVGAKINRRLERSGSGLSRERIL